jgi:hypothetical protein
MRLGLTVVTFFVPGLDLVDESGFVLDAVCKTLTTQMAEFDLGHVEPTPVFGGIMDFQCIGDSFRLLRNKRFIQRSLMMGIQIIHDQTDLLSVWRHLIHQRVHIVRKINFCPVIRYCSIALTTQWFKSEKDVCRTMPLIFCVLLTRFPRLGREGIADFPNELSRHVIATHLWTRWIIGVFIDI